MIPKFIGKETHRLNKPEDNAGDFFMLHGLNKKSALNKCLTDVHRMGKIVQEEHQKTLKNNNG